MNDVYINSFGAYLPGAPVVNSQIEDHIGLIGGKPSKNRALTLRHNKIRTRHYALDNAGQPTTDTAEMAAEAVRDAVKKSEVVLNDITYLATATTIGDFMVPGLSSHVHANLNLPPIEIASFQSVCASSMMALKSAYLQLAVGEHRCAAISGSEFASRYFRPAFYEQTNYFQAHNEIPYQQDFLRFTLSDGAGAAILEIKPNDRQLSFKVVWIDIRSYADRFDASMTAGAAKVDGQWKYWGDFSGPGEAAKAGALVLAQDFELMKSMLPVWVSHYLDLIDLEKVNPNEIDFVCCHYSSQSLRDEVFVLLKQAGALIAPDKWFSNLATKGNTGSASIFILLEELYRTQPLRRGQKILCHVPESGRALNSFMMLEVI